MIDWERVPWPLWASIALGVIVSLVGIGIGNTDRLLLVAFFPIGLVVDFFLLRGVRWLWIFILVTSSISILMGLALGPRTYALAVEILSTGLLLMPQTRQFFAKPATTGDRSQSASPQA